LLNSFDMDASLTPLNLALGLIACLFAVCTGAYLAKKQANAFKGDQNSGVGTPGNDSLPAVTFADYGDMRFLHLGTPAVQGSMKISQPFDIHLNYVQRMMGWLLFTDIDKVEHMHAMQLGLGAASLTKFCYHHLGMQTTAIELNPQVIATCKRWFHLPENDAKLQVIEGDAGEAASQGRWQGKIDALQVDLYDQESACPAIDSEAFYRNCRELLTDQGCMAVNLFGRAMSYPASVQKITAAFGEEAVWSFKPTSAGNTIVLAFRTARPLDPIKLQMQAQAVQTRWPLPASKWLKVLAPIQSTKA
jgi:spermidine synthase